MSSEPGDPNDIGGASRSVCSAYYTGQRPMFSVGSCVWDPPADVYETEEALVVKIEVAGADPKEIAITVEGNSLTVRGYRRDGDQQAQLRLQHVEIRYGQFERIFMLPPNLNLSAMKADYENGFLIIHTPKRYDPPRTIRVDSD